MKRVMISKGGQISVPAEIRRRWGTRTLTMLDQGDQVVLRPAPDDPIAAARGALKSKGRGLSSAGLRRIVREEDSRIEERRWGSS